MEQGGWLDQFLLGIVGFLNQPWLAIVVAVGGGFAVAYLARMSPKEDWEFISEWPGRVLTGAFLVLASARSAPRLVWPPANFTCDRAIGPLGIPVDTNCRFVPGGQLQVVHDYTFRDLVRDFLGSLLQDAVLGAVGAAVGVTVAIIVRRRRRASSADAG